MKFLKFILLILMSVFVSIDASSKVNNSNQAEAKKLFDKVYNMVFGNEGCSLTYSVNIIGLYKTEGDVIYKGKKSYFEDKKLYCWNDGTTIYRVDKKDKVVNIYRSGDDRADKYMAKFKFDANNFTYSYTTKNDYYEITAKVKKSSFMGIKHVTAVVSRKNLYPVSLKIKVGFLSTTVKISNFKYGNINPSVFTYPMSRFSSYSVEDYRNK